MNLVEGRINDLPLFDISALKIQIKEGEIWNGLSVVGNKHLDSALEVDVLC